VYGWRVHGSVFSSGGGLIQAAVGIGGNCGGLFLNRFGFARKAASRVDA